MTETADRFSHKIKAYARYRWDFTPAAIDAIFAISGLRNDAVVADIGAGTGLLSRHFIGRIAQLNAVEPNAEMRRVLEDTLADIPYATAIEGTAAATMLPDDSADLIVVGRAIHWFSPTLARTEFRRILKPSGWLAILQVPCTDASLLDAIRELRTAEFGWDVNGDKWNRHREPLSFFYGHDQLISRRFPSEERETWPQFLGRLTSLSSAPNPGDAHYPVFEQAANTVFDRFRRGDELVIDMATDLTIAQLAPEQEAEL